MPLVVGASNSTRDKNIREMIRSGHDRKQAIAAGYSTQRKAKRKSKRKGDRK